MPVIWLWHPWRQLQESRFALGFEKERDLLYRLCFGTKCLRLSSRNFSTREMRFLRRPRDVARRTQLSGSNVCVCVCASGLCVTFYVGILALFLRLCCRVLMKEAWRIFWTSTFSSTAVFFIIIIIINLKRMWQSAEETWGNCYALCLLVRSANRLMLDDSAAAARCFLLPRKPALFCWYKTIPAACCSE